jgi:hypothetical protein
MLVERSTVRFFVGDKAMVSSEGLPELGLVSKSALSDLVAHIKSQMFHKLIISCKGILAKLNLYGCAIFAQIRLNEAAQYDSLGEVFFNG